jgi:hypothetical protein
VDSPAAPIDPTTELELLRVAEARRAHSDQFAWTVPGLALTAEAFLLTIALASSTKPLGRLLAVLAGTAALAGAWQFLSKHTYLFRLYDAVVERQRRTLVLASLQPEDLERSDDFPRQVADSLQWSKTRAAARGSVATWKGILLVLIAIDVFVGVYAVVAIFHDPGWLS